MPPPPPPKETKKKLQCEDFGEESKTSNTRRKEKGKGKEKVPHQQEQINGIQSEDFGGESKTSNTRSKGKGKGKEKVPHQQEEELNGIQFLSLGASANPRPQKPGTRHSKRVDYYLDQYRDEMSGQDKDEEEKGRKEEKREGEGEAQQGAGYPGVSERAEPLSRKRSFRKAEFHPSDESESGTSKVRRSMRNVPDTVGRPNTRAAGRTERNQSPPTGFRATGNSEGWPRRPLGRPK